MDTLDGSDPSLIDMWMNGWDIEPRTSQSDMEFSSVMESESMVPESSPYTSTKIPNKSIRIKLPSVLSTQSKCFICDLKVRTRIPKKAIAQVLRVKGVRIPPGNRCCSSHLHDKLLKPQELDGISVAKEYSDMKAEEVEEIIKSLTNQVRKKHSDLNELPEDKFPILTGLTKEQFFNLLDICKPGINDSPNRTKATALGIFLAKLRMDLSDVMLGLLFECKSVSNTIKTVRKALINHFVPLHLGFDHKTKEELIEQHSVNSFNRLLELDDSSLSLILDGTYLYIEKPTDFELQWITWSGQKKRHLVKPMMVVTTSGYIVDCPGKYGANGHNNDASIMKHMMSVPNGIQNLVDGEAAFILDRGFRDCIVSLEEENIKCFMPNLLARRQKQFTDEQANKSRLVTMIRYIVESANGRVKKKFKFFRNVISNNHFHNLMDFFRIGCAIINAYCPPLKTESVDLERKIELALHRKDIKNTLQDEIESERMDRRKRYWNEGNQSNATDFPKISDKDMEILTLGTFQSEMAKEYICHHLKKDPEFEIKYSKTGKIVQAHIQSKYVRAKKHQCFVKYDETKTGHLGITGYFCKCNSGARTLGCCSHVAALVWYLGNVRWNLESLPKKKDLSKYVINAKDRPVDRAPRTSRADESDSEPEADFGEDSDVDSESDGE